MPKLPFFSIKNAPKFAKAVGGKLKDIAYLPTSLETVEKIDMRFDPWRKDSSSIKQVWTQLCSEKTRQTNQFCLITHSVLSDNSESILSLTYSNGQILDSEILSVTRAFQIFGYRIMFLKRRPLFVHQTPTHQHQSSRHAITQP